MSSSEVGRSPRFCIDLFAGAGGLSKGLETAGFTHVLAVEKSDMAGWTYYENFIRGKHGAPADDWTTFHYPAESPDEQKARLVRQIGLGLAVAGTAQVIDEMDAVRARIRSVREREGLKGEEVDLIAGGPPCQGFSLAGMRNPEDQRNQLPYEFLRFVHELKPRVVLIENVAGIKLAFSGKGKRKHGAAEAVLPQLVKALEDELGYKAQVWHVNARHFEVAQNRPRIMIAAIRLDLLTESGVVTDAWEREWFSGLREPGRQSAMWTTEEPHVEPSQGVRMEPSGACAHREIPLREELDEIADTAVPARKPETPRRGPRSKPSRALPNHVLRSHGSRTTARFALAAWLASKGLPDNLFYTITLENGRERVQYLLGGIDDPRPPKAVTKCLSDADLDPLDPLLDIIEQLGTRKHSQRLLRPDLPAPTMMSLPDDHIHYASPRTLTVREMARIQSFPDEFVFYGRETTGAHRRRVDVPQYTQVGNAVPPRLAAAVGTHLRDLLDTLDRRISNRSGRSSGEAVAGPAD